MNSHIPDSQELAEQVREEVRTAEVQEYGPEKLACGPGIEKEDTLIIVEGRADVINLLRNNIKNVICMGGSKIPQSLIELAKQKTVTLFIDGDRGGLLNVRKFEQLGDIDFIARAPDGKEVEELARKEIMLSLRRKTAFEQFNAQAASQRERHSPHSREREFQKEEYEWRSRIED